MSKRVRFWAGLFIAGAVLITLPLAIASAASGATIRPAPLATRFAKPDGRVRIASHGYPGSSKATHDALIGNNVYNSTAARQAVIQDACCAGLEGEFFVSEISIQNDGTVAGRFKVKATGSAAPAWRIVYRHGTTDISAAVRAGTFQTPSLAPGATYLITAKATGWETTFTRLVTIRSASDASKLDAVKFGSKYTACTC